MAGGSPPGATILGCAGPALTAGERAFFRAADPWGFILFARNVESPAQLRRLTADLREAVGREAPVLVDQEGGRVQRLRAPHWREWLPPLDQVARTGSNAARAMGLRYRLIAHELRAAGLDANCAPCADIATADTHPFLRNRCYGSDLASVVWVARAVADALLAGGVLPVVKHLPGHGRATTDSHLSLPTVTADADTLRQSDFATFRALNDLPMAMTAHIVYTAFDPDRPATQSPTLLRLIRDEIGFGGLLVTDDLSMQALAGSIGDRAGAAIAAGCDIALHCNGEIPEMEAVVAAAGHLSAAGARRAAAALAARHLPAPIDIAAAEAELESLLDGQADG
ncbi:beta-N-acetylhexosaminidase [Acidimangrovimonas pyrenivorans]|uniref:beta-N-acetylhexosaminidase n=1 Tax=Acidimangrovimonas pyrenivorans TaxID=2030798 RepID=A0ABV7AEM4_9RHOB